MIQLTIDHITLSVPDDSTVMEAARAAGISIPSMCYLKGYGNHPSCMVCMVKDRSTENLFASCAMPVREGMNISTCDEDVLLSRKEALELLMSDHVGDCEAPCSLACPANMDIPQMNRLLADGQYENALKVVRETIALPYILGYICPAPCEKACRRKQIDNPVSICLLKRASAAEGDVMKDLTSGKGNLKPAAKKVAIIGTGPAGLAAAFYLLRSGINCTLFDAHDEAGGALRYSIPEHELPRTVLDAEINVISALGAEFRLGTAVSGEQFRKGIQKEFHAVIIATGDFPATGFFLDEIKSSKSGILVNEHSLETSIPGVFACGSILRSQKMAVRAAAQGRDAAQSVILFLEGKTAEPKERKFNSRFEKLFPEEFEVYLQESVRDNRYSPAEYLTGFTEKEVKKEAARCLHCDCRKIDECKLRDYCDEYKADRRKYLTGERNKMLKFDQHDFVIYEPEKCIRCGLCIDIALKEKETTGLAFFGRGFDVRMNVPFRDSFSKALTHAAIKCVENCPTGSLSLKHKKP
jgi:NADPH-dependent glutamate synthase beta subunit-like oxidoreductase/ferredoxin